MVHRGVGVAQDVLRGGVIDGAGRDPQAGPDRELLAVEIDHLGQASLIPASDRQDVERVDVVQQDRELVTAEPGAGVHRTQLTLDAGADRVQDAVAHLVPEGVVDGLEPVEVEEDHDERRLGAVPQSDRVLEPKEKVPPVRQPGQCVVEGVLSQLVLEGPAFVDVRERADDPLDQPALWPHPERAGQHPPVRAVRGPDPILGVGRLLLADGGAAHAPAHLREVVRVNQSQPLGETIRPGVGLETQHRAATVGQVEVPGSQIPLPQPVVRRPSGKGIALLTLAYRLLEALLLEGGAQLSHPVLVGLDRGRRADLTNEGEQAPVAVLGPHRHDDADAKVGRVGCSDQGCRGKVLGRHCGTEDTQEQAFRVVGAGEPQPARRSVVVPQRQRAGTDVRFGEPVEVAWVGPTGLAQSGGDRVLLHERSLGGLHLLEERAGLHLP